jgi:hypothetical protein
MQVRETYTPVKLTASGTLVPGIGSTGGFLCTTAGTLRLLTGGAAGTELVPSFAVAAGTFYPLPFSYPSTGCYAELGGGAAGTFAVAG